MARAFIDREPARQMLERALDNGVPVGWVIGDCVYGGNRSLRHWLEAREQPFVLAVPCNGPLWWQGSDYTRTEEVADALPPDAQGGLLRELRRAGVRHIKGVSALRAEGNGQLEHALWQQQGDDTWETLDTLTLILHQGVVPNAQITRAVDCHHEWDEQQ